MKTDLKFVFDTNVIVSGFFFPKSLPRAALYSASEIGQILYSRGTLDELWDVIMRPKFDRYLPLAARLEELVSFQKFGLEIEVSTKIQLCRDPKDDKFLSLAFDGAASCLISGDQDLLVLAGSFRIPILSPADFLAGFQEKN